MPTAYAITNEVVSGTLSFERKTRLVLLKVVAIELVMI